MSQVPQVTADTFSAEVLQSSIPVLVDFFTVWCGPCQMLAPVLDRTAGEYAGRLKIVKVNAEEQELLATQYRIEGYPTLILFRDGQVLDRIDGAPPPPMLKRWLTQHLEPAPA